MRRFVAICLLALCGQAMADITMLLGPDGKPLANGKYRLLIIPADASKPPVNSVLDVGGTDGPVPPIVPPVIPVDTLDAKLTLLLAAVEDGEKASTGAKLKVAYEMTLQLTANSITDANSLRGVMAGIEKGVLDSLKKTAGWQPWVNGLGEIVKPMDFQQCLTTYRAAAAKLGGTAPVPPLDPPSPPLPVTTAVRVTYVFEKDSNAVPQGVARALQAINAAGSAVASDIDDDVTDGDGDVPDQYRIAIAEAVKAGLPALVVQKLDGTVKVVKDPKTEAQVMEAMQ